MHILLFPPHKINLIILHFFTDFNVLAYSFSLCYVFILFYILIMKKAPDLHLSEA